MALTFRVELPPSLQGKGKVAEVDRMRPSILQEGGKALQELLAAWMVDLDATRSRHGSHHFTPDDVHEPVVEGESVSVSISTPGINRALHDIIIRPVEAQALALPVNEAAYGIQPRRYNVNHPKGTPEALFRPKGKDYLAKKGPDGGLVVMYLLRDSVTQPQDRSLLPPDDKMDKAFSGAVHDAVEAILNS